MNETLELLKSHRSVRRYTDAEVGAAELDEIVEAGRRCPTSFNAQHVSVVVVRSPETRAAIARIAGGQHWIEQAPVFITLVADASKTGRAVHAVGQTQQAQRSVELLLACSIDAGIALGAMMTAARSLGFGVVAIGGIRRNPQAMIDLLGLPELTLPLCGMCVGAVAQEGRLKPRLPVETFRHDEHYSLRALAAAMPEYDSAMLAYWQALGRVDGTSWSANLAEHYCKNYFPNVKPVAQSQGFTLEG